MKRMVMGIWAVAAVSSFGGTVCGLRNDAAANRAAIQREIDATNAAGGGRVIIPAGEWPCGSLELKSGVDLHLAKGTVLKGSTRQADYNADDVFPENFACKSEEWSGGHLVYAYKAHDVAITGEGVIDGNGLAFFPIKPDEDHRFPWYKYGLKLHTIDRTWHRPGPMVAMFLTKNIRLEGVTLRNTPCWTAHFRCCEGLVATNVTIDADRTIANSDGFSIDSTRKVRVSDCRVLTGDDGFAIRASCKHHAKDNVCGDILIENCDISSCCYGIRFGVGTGTIRGVEVRNCRVLEAANGFGFTTAWRDTGGRNCYIEDVTIQDAQVGNCAQAFEAVNFMGDCRVANIRCENCRFEALLPCVIRGNEKAWPRDIAFSNCTLRLLKRLAGRDPGTQTGWMPKCENPPRKFLNLSGKSERVTATNCRIVDGRSVSNFVRRAEAGDRLNVVWFGGSLTWGANASDPNRTSLRALVSKRLEETYPKAHFRFKDAAIGGAGSTMEIFRVARDVLSEHPDLVFFDCLVNDGEEGEGDLADAAEESIIRRLIAESKAAVVPIMIPWSKTIETADGASFRRWHRQKELCRRYSLVSADILGECRRRFAARKLDMKAIWPDDFPDRLHPYDPGYRLYADILWEQVFVHPSNAVPPSALPPWLGKSTYAFVKRQPIASAAVLPTGWRKTLPWLRAGSFDFSCSRWMDSMCAAANCTRTGWETFEPNGISPAALKGRFRGEVFGLMGESMPHCGAFRLVVDGKEVFKSYATDKMGKNFPPSAYLFTWPKGGFDPSVWHNFEVVPLFGAKDAPAELRLESVCVAGSETADVVFLH